MAGLLSLGQRQGPQLLGQPVFDGLLRQVNALPPVRPMADAADEQMAARAALLQPTTPAPRARDRVSGWRVFDRVLGGQTVTESLDAERARLQAEADRPRLLAEQARLAGLARTYGPLAELAVGLNPDKAGEAFASNIEGYTLGAGGVRGGINGPVAGAPTTTTVNDQIYQNDPLTRTSTLIATADPSFGDQTARINALNPINVAPGGQLRDPQTGELVAQGADRVFSAADATDLVNERGQPIYQNQRDAPTQRPAAALEIENRVSAINTDVTPTLGRMRSLLESGDVITGLGAEARLNADRALAAIGNQDAQRRVAATEEYRNTAARLRVGMAKSLGANPSNADLTILEQVTGGNIGQNRDSLLATIAQGEQMSQRQLTAAEQQLRQFGGQSAGQSAPSAPAGISREAAIAEARRRGLIP